MLTRLTQSLHSTPALLAHVLTRWPVLHIELASLMMNVIPIVIMVMLAQTNAYKAV